MSVGKCVVSSQSQMEFVGRNLCLARHCRIEILRAVEKTVVLGD